MKNEMYFTKKFSGSSRDKRFSTNKQDKWKDPFYAEARGRSSVKHLVSHKVDSIRNSVPTENSGLLKGFISAISSLFSRIFRRKVIS